MRKSGESDLFKHAGHFREQIHGDAVGFAQFDAECMHGEHRPFGEPVTPLGVGGFIRVSDNCFSLSDRNTGEETEFQSHNTPSLRFLQR